MIKYAMLIENDKGLYFSDGERVYFPNLHSKTGKNLTKGLVHVTAEKDMGTYSFIDGEMIQTDDIVELITAGKIEPVEFVNYTNVYTLNGANFIVKTDDLIFYLNGEPIHLFDISEGKQTNKHYRDRCTTFCSRACLQALATGITDQVTKAMFLYLNKLPKLPDRTVLFEKIVSKASVTYTDILVTDTLVKIIYRSGTVTMYYNGDNLVPIPLDAFTNKAFVSGFRSVKGEYMEFLKKYHITDGFYEGMITKRVTAMGETFEVSFMSNVNFSIKNYEKYKADIEGSHAEIEAARKRLGKFITKSNLEEFSKLSVGRLQFD